LRTDSKDGTATHEREMTTRQGRRRRSVRISTAYGNEVDWLGEAELDPRRVACGGLLW
jgi:hypothetical protein